MKYPTWVIWFTLFVVVVMIFPKECERVPLSKVFEYKCIGIDKIFTSKIQSQNQTINWCSGVCTSKSLNPLTTSNQNIKTSSKSNDPASGLISSFTKIIPPLAIILIIIFIIKWISSLKKGDRGGLGEIKVIRGPGQ